MGIDCGIEDPSSEDVRRIQEAHLAFARRVTPADGVFALDVSGLHDPSVTVFGARRDGELVGIGAIKALSRHDAELKSMHTVEAARRAGVARVLLGYLIDQARLSGFGTLSLETGTMEAFAPARAFYERSGFVVCAPFGEYVGSVTSVCMTMNLIEVHPTSH